MSSALKKKVAETERVHAYLSRHSLSYYLEHVVINSNPEPARFGTVAEDWQRQLVAPKIPMFEALAGLRGDYTGPWSFCDILARGHDKTSLEGRLATWALLASRRHIAGYIIAEDRDQGALVLDAMEVEAKLNPWVAKQLTFTRGLVTGPAGQIEVVPADAGSAYGLRGNLFIFDEWANWKKPKCRDVWRAVFSGTEKISPRVLGVVTNAGYLGSWQDGIYRTFQRNPDYVVWDKPGQLASWMSPSRVAELKKAETPAEGRRLFDNAWIDLGEDSGYLTLEQARGCVSGRLRMRFSRQPGVDNYVLIVDYGPTRDRTVFLVAHAAADGEVIVDRCDVMTGVTSVETVEARIDSLIAAFKPERIVIDPYQMLGTIQRLQRQRQPVEEVKFRGGNLNHELCECLRTAVCHRLVTWYAGCGALPEDSMELELARLVTKRKDYGFRFDHVASGHDDRAFCLAMAIHQCPQLPARG